MITGEWHNLDTDTAFHLCCTTLHEKSARNFAVRFNTHQAHCSLNLSPVDIEVLLQGADKETQAQQTRWINFWEAESDAHAIRAISERYGLSPRLTTLLCSTQASPARSSSVEPKHQQSAVNGGGNSVKTSDADLEKALYEYDSSSKSAVGACKLPAFGDVVHDLWHFCSVDRGPHYLYVGFNALSTVPGMQTEQALDSRKPAGLRIWTSLLLCDDGTVVSIFEKPPISTSPAYINAMRFNVLNIFRHLSKIHSITSEATLMQVSVRPCSSADQAATNDADSPALLFYYLFDDWRATYSLITGRDHPYRERLEVIRQEMFETAEMSLIRSLDLVGRQLIVLKLMYKSYELITHRILKHSIANDPPLQSKVFDCDGGAAVDTLFESPGSRTGMTLAVSPSHYQSTQTEHGFSLPQSTVVRFERLLDRIRLYALTEIEDCLTEKESLVLMNFNLVALKESQAVEKLTRTTILLTKATILFLPVSLMTGYFSVQLTEIEELYNLKTYWVCFLVVVVTSIIGLVTFSVATDRVGGRTTYKSLTRTSWERMQRGKTRRR